MTDVERIMEIRENKMALQNLLTKGQIGDETWNHILEAEKELDSEIYEVVQEANTFKAGWGQIIFAHAGDEVQHEKHKKFWEDIEEQKRKLSALLRPSHPVLYILIGVHLTAEKYSAPQPLIKPRPILGISAANPKKRTLPSSVPSSANVPPSKPSTPVPQRVMQGPPGSGPQAQQMSPAQMQQAAQLQAAIRAQQAQMLAQQQQAAGAGAGASVLPPVKPTNGATPAVSPAKGTATPPKPATNGSSTKQSPPGPMLRQESMMSTASGVSSVGEGADSDADDDGQSVGTSAGPGSNVTSPRKTPNKKGKKKNKGKKK
jgi:translocation protein SEC66